MRDQCAGRPCRGGVIPKVFNQPPCWHCRDDMLVPAPFSPPLQTRQNRAARVVQAAWKAYKARKVAEAKKKKKAEAAGKKKK